METILGPVGRNWTTEQAASLAADASALKAAQGLATPRKWTVLGRDDEFVWGLAQGSGAEPYQVQIDLSEPAFKCSCPSRKFPCKHGLGLLLVYAADPGGVASGAKPSWVSEWAAKRAEKAAKVEATPSSQAEAPDPEAQARRRQKREANVEQGVVFLEGWLRDLVRQGLATVASSGYAFWDTPARRLVDAQAPGLARRVRALGASVSGVSGTTEERAIAELGRLHLLVSAARRKAALPPEWQDEINAQLGWTTDQEALRRQDGIKGVWLVGAQTVREDDKIITRASYLFGRDGRVAQLLEFSPSAHPSLASFALGRWLEGELIPFPGVNNPRALWKAPPTDAAPGELRFCTQCAEVLDEYAASVARNPFIDSLATVVELTPMPRGDQWLLQDTAAAALPVERSFAFGWELLACSGGRPLRMVGLWDGFAFAPLTVLTEAGPLALGSRGN